MEQDVGFMTNSMASSLFLMVMIKTLRDKVLFQNNILTPIKLKDIELLPLKPKNKKI